MIITNEMVGAALERLQKMPMGRWWQSPRLTMLEILEVALSAAGEEVESPLRAPPPEGKETAYVWLDEDGVRCSPRHSKMIRAIEFYENPDELWVTKGGKPQLVNVDRSLFPSQKDPVRLVVGHWDFRDPTPEEQDRIERAMPRSRRPTRDQP